MEADQYIPYPLDEVNTDFQVLAHRKKIPIPSMSCSPRPAARMSRCVSPRLRPAVYAKMVDIEAYALENVFSLLASQIPDKA